MRHRVVARRRRAARADRHAEPAAATRRRAPLSVPAVRTRWPIAIACAVVAAAAPASAQSRSVTLAAPAALAACAAATAEPGERSRAVLRAAMRCTVNAERTARGLRGLRPDRRLNRAAKRHARDMVRRGYFAHERPGWTLASRLQDAGWRGGSAAEAIAWGCSGRGSARATLHAWLTSPSHRAIVLGGYRRAGVGIALGTPTGARCGAGATWVLDVGA